MGYGGGFGWFRPAEQDEELAAKLATELDRPRR